MTLAGPDATYALQPVAFQPVSYVPGLLLSASPRPPFKCVCLPLPFAGGVPVGLVR